MKRKHTAVAGRQPGLNLEHRAQPASLFMVLWGVAVLCLAVVTYFFGLDSLQIPKNGDEFPYAHIAIFGNLQTVQHEEVSNDRQA